MTTNNGAGGLVAKWRERAAQHAAIHAKQRGYEVDWTDDAKSDAYEACADELEAALQAPGETPPPSDVLRRVVEAAEAYLSSYEAEFALREALAAAHKALAEGVDRG